MPNSRRVNSATSADTASLTKAWARSGLTLWKSGSDAKLSTSARASASFRCPSAALTSTITSA